MAAARIRRRTLETRLAVLEPDDDDRETDDGEREEDEPCLFCSLVDEVADVADEVDDSGDAAFGETVHEQLATAFAYGAIVFAQGHGVATCDRCNKQLDEALRVVRKELRKARPRRRASD
jgi:hypothetical protein